MILKKSPFIIYALPRSRTYWLSKFLSHGVTKCGHDEMRYIRGLDDIKSLLNMPFYGSVETGAAPWWRLIHAMRPDIRTAIIRRPVEQVVASVMATGVGFDEARLTQNMKRLDAKLDQIKARIPDVLEISFDDLREQHSCSLLFEHCTGKPPASGWFEFMDPLKMTIDFEAMIRYYQAHTAQLERVGRLAKQRMLQKLHHKRTLTTQAMTYQQEPFDQFLEDAKDLFVEHATEVGEAPDAWKNKNTDLMRVLESVGALYVTTARCNGKMFGYLMSIVSPALDTHSGVDGTHTLFYCSPDAPGIGLKLQRASVEFLRNRGVDRVAFRAGTRASGEKASALFRRLGAQDVGQMFTLDLKETA